MRDPVDLVARLGEGWCVTVTRGDVFEALSGMEVDPAATGPADQVRPAAGVVLFAREIGPDLTLVVEIDGRTGWVGARTEVLGTLSANGGMACSLTKNPNREELLHAVDGTVVVGLDPATTRRWGARPALFDDRLAGAGFPGPDGDDGDALRFSPVRRGVLALEVMTGVRLEPAMFDGPWTAGPSY